MPEISATLALSDFKDPPAETLILIVCPTEPPVPPTVRAALGTEEAFVISLFHGKEGIVSLTHRHFYFRQLAGR